MAIHSPGKYWNSPDVNRQKRIVSKIEFELTQRREHWGRQADERAQTALIHRTIQSLDEPAPPKQAPAANETILSSTTLAALERYRRDYASKEFLEKFPRPMAVARFKAAAEETTPSQATPPRPSDKHELEPVEKISIQFPAVATEAERAQEGAASELTPGQRLTFAVLGSNPYPIDVPGHGQWKTVFKAALPDIDVLLASTPQFPGLPASGTDDYAAVRAWLAGLYIGAFDICAGHRLRFVSDPAGVQDYRKWLYMELGRRVIVAIKEHLSLSKFSSAASPPALVFDRTPHHSLHDEANQTVRSPAVGNEVERAKEAAVRVGPSDDGRTYHIPDGAMALTPAAAQVIEILVEQYSTGVVNVDSKYILERIGRPDNTGDTRLRDIVGRDVYKALLEAGDKKGTVRLKHPSTG